MTRTSRARLRRRLWGRYAKRRTRDAVGGLAASVYNSVFASGSPPPHVLLRDYARGVVERALHLGSTIEDLTQRSFVLPYKSEWPSIPSEDVKPLLPDWSKGSHDGRAWSGSCHRNVSLQADFALHHPVRTRPQDLVISLSLQLDGHRGYQESCWKRVDRACRRPLSRWKLPTLAGLRVADRAYAAASSGVRTRAWFTDQRGADDQPALGNHSESGDARSRTRRITANSRFNRKTRGRGRGVRLRATSAEHAAPQALSGLMEQHTASRPRWSRSVRRYILKRVFDLGWTPGMAGISIASSCAATARAA